MPLQPSRLDPNDALYPANLRTWGEPPPPINCIGNLELLLQPSIALFCSRQCPGKLVNLTYDLAQRFRDAGKPVIGGFHSPMEQECLRILLRGNQPVIICPARGIQDARTPADWQTGLNAGRLLIISPFDKEERRVTRELAERRNRFVVALAAEVFIGYAAPDSSTLQFARELSDRGVPLLTHDAPESAPLLKLGARAVTNDDYPVTTDLGQMQLFD